MRLAHRGVRVAAWVGLRRLWGRLALRLCQIGLYLGLCGYEASVRSVELNNIVLQVLGFVDDRHVLEFGKKPVGFTVSLIKI